MATNRLRSFSLPNSCRNPAQANNNLITNTLEIGYISRPLRSIRPQLFVEQMVAVLFLVV